MMLFLDPLVSAHQARPQHPRRRRGRADRGPDGRQHRQDHLAHLRHRRCPRRRRRLPLRQRASCFSNTMGFIPGVKAFAAAVLGGIGNIRGAMLGGLLLGVVEATWCRQRPGTNPGGSASSGPTWSRSSSWSWSWSFRPTGHPRRASGACGMKRRSDRGRDPDRQRQALRGLPGRRLRAGPDGRHRRRAPSRTSATPSAQAVVVPRIFVFLGIGVLLYLAITFGPRVKPYLTRPGLRPLGAGVADRRGLAHAAEVDRQPADRHRQVPAAGQRGRADTGASTRSPGCSSARRARWTPGCC